MPLQSSASGANPLKMSEVVTELGGPGNLRAYLRNSAYVIDIDANAGVPTSGTISLLDLLGASAAGFKDSADGTMVAIDNAGNPEINLGFTSAGTYVATVIADTGNGIASTKWRSGYGVGASGSNYYLKAVITAGPGGDGGGAWILTGGALFNTWLTTTSNRYWNLVGNGVGIGTYDVTFYLSTSASDAGIFDSKVFDFAIDDSP